ncbi:MAG: polysaccharide biosynthesis transport protein, partial [Alphaproteobacteria bacterium]|nr:polysaccharide biosynthesis transport protein [Alphaproteobacteria bacterium]
MNPSNELIRKESADTAVGRPADSNGVPHSYNYGVDPNAESEVHLLDYWRAVRKRLWLVISIVILISTLALINAAQKPDIYSANARVQVDLENNGALVGKTPYYMPAFNDPVYFNTQLQILGSKALARRVVKTLDLEHNPDFFRGSQKRTTWQTIKMMAGFRTDAPEATAAKPKDELQLRTTVVPDSSPQEDQAEAKRLNPYVYAVLGGLRVDPVKESRGTFKET